MKGHKRVIEILDAKYDKANLPEIVKDNCSHLEPSQREKLLSLLLDYESLFDGTLGWNRPPISVKMKEGAKPYHGRPYPIPQVHKTTLMKEINRLESIRVLKGHLVGFVGCRHCQFRCDIDVLVDMSATCRKMLAQHSRTSAIFLRFWPRQCRVVFVSCRHVGVYIGRN